LQLGYISWAHKEIVNVNYLVQGRSPIPGISSWRFLEVLERKEQRKERKVNESRAVPKGLKKKVEHSKVSGPSEHNKKDGGRS
jgi:hypothetical protein